jgi:hypothetical protein
MNLEWQAAFTEEVCYYTAVFSGPTGPVESNRCTEAGGSIITNRIFPGFARRIK